MKVVAINGSARKDGNTAILVKTKFEARNSKFETNGKTQNGNVPNTRTSSS